MALKFVVDSIDEIDTSLRSHYVEENGKFTLVTQGDHPKVAEFRDKNVALLKAAAKFDGIDLDAIKGDRDKIAALEAKLATTPQLESELQVERTARVAAEVKANRAVLRDTLRATALAAGVLPAALDILLDKAEPAFEVKNDGVQARVFSASRPGELMTPQEWVAGAIHEFPFLFGASSGSGSHPKRGGGTGDGKRVLTNPTPQDLGRHASEIARGTVRIEYTT